MPTLKIDGREVTVERGTTILEAARQVGVDIPTFCYHPGLTKPANCRMCLVDTNKAPKPTPACYAECMDDMEVSTQSPEIVKTRKAVLEFILLNHPVDCPICDQAGECKLQDHYGQVLGQPPAGFAQQEGPQAEGQAISAAHRVLDDGALHPVHALHSLLRRGRRRDAA
jgi:predicted molibdopterin-dependent oxidoreductase YjgC